MPMLEKTLSDIFDATLMTSICANEILDSLIQDKPLKPGSYRGRKNTSPEKHQKVNGENHA